MESSDLRLGDLILVEAGDTIPADAEVLEGVASVDESAITGESAPVIRESGGDFSSITGGTRVLSDWLVARVSANPGEAFLDRMISMVEGAKRHRTPNGEKPPGATDLVAPRGLFRLPRRVAVECDAPWCGTGCYTYCATRRSRRPALKFTISRTTSFR